MAGEIPAKDRANRPVNLRPAFAIVVAILVASALAVAGAGRVEDLEAHIPANGNRCRGCPHNGTRALGNDPDPIKPGWNVGRNLQKRQSEGDPSRTRDGARGRGKQADHRVTFSS